MICQICLIAHSRPENCFQALSQRASIVAMFGNSKDSRATPQEVDPTEPPKHFLDAHELGRALLVFTIGIRQCQFDASLDGLALLHFLKKALHGVIDPLRDRRHRVQWQFLAVACPSSTRASH
jgi:hypothetical protein